MFKVLQFFMARWRITIMRSILFLVFRIPYPVSLVLFLYAKTKQGIRDTGYGIQEKGYYAEKIRRNEKTRMQYKE